MIPALKEDQVLLEESSCKENEVECNTEKRKQRRALIRSIDRDKKSVISAAISATSLIFKGENSFVIAKRATMIWINSDEFKLDHLISSKDDFNIAFKWALIAVRSATVAYAHGEAEIVSESIISAVLTAASGYKNRESIDTLNLALSYASNIVLDSCGNLFISDAVSLTIRETYVRCFENKKKFNSGICKNNAIEKKKLMHQLEKAEEEKKNMQRNMIKIKTAIKEKQDKNLVTFNVMMNEAKLWSKLAEVNRDISLLSKHSCETEAVKLYEMLLDFKRALEINIKQLKVLHKNESKNVFGTCVAEAKDREAIIKNKDERKRYESQLKINIQAIEKEKFILNQQMMKIEEARQVKKKSGEISYSFGDIEKSKTCDDSPRSMELLKYVLREHTKDALLSSANQKNCSKCFKEENPNVTNDINIFSEYHYLDSNFIDSSEEPSHQMMKIEEARQVKKKSDEISYSFGNIEKTITYDDSSRSMELLNYIQRAHTKDVLFSSAKQKNCSKCFKEENPNVTNGINIFSDYHYSDSNFIDFTEEPSLKMRKIEESRQVETKFDEVLYSLDDIEKTTTYDDDSQRPKELLNYIQKAHTKDVLLNSANQKNCSKCFKEENPNVTNDINIFSEYHYSESNFIKSSEELSHNFQLRKFDSQGYDIHSENTLAMPSTFHRIDLIPSALSYVLCEQDEIEIVYLSLKSESTDDLSKEYVSSFQEYISDQEVISNLDSLNDCDEFPHYESCFDNTVSISALTTPTSYQQSAPQFSKYGQSLQSDQGSVRSMDRCNYNLFSLGSKQSVARRKVKTFRKLIPYE